mmetsp:Transcript_10888/g.30858  ORF Transcript_10888/g.30858 Transcript_10888/m.30858 type:complete len:157 (-) Transcript_10888:256-726(-)
MRGPESPTATALTREIIEEVGRSVRDGRSAAKGWAEKLGDDMARKIVRLDMGTAWKVGVALNVFCLTGYVGWGLAFLGTAFAQQHVAIPAAQYAGSMTLVTPPLKIIGLLAMVYGAPSVPRLERALHARFPGKMAALEEILARARAEAGRPGPPKD